MRRIDKISVRKVIFGRVYDTDTAALVCNLSTERDETGLYRTKRGSWFIAGRSEPRGRWDEGMVLMDLRLLNDDEARRLLEQFGTVEEFAAHFEVEEG